MSIMKRLRLFIGLLFCAVAFAQYPANTANSGSGGGGGGDATKTAIQAGTYTYCSASAGDAYTCSLTPTLTAYTAGQCVVLDPDTTNTGAATLNIDALGVKDILGPFGSVLAAGDLPAGKMSTLCYNGTAFIRQGGNVSGGSSLSTAGAVPYVSASGVLNQDASNFFWDATSHRLGIGTASPGYSLHVSGGGGFSEYWNVAGGNAYGFRTTGNDGLIQNASSGEQILRFKVTTQNVIIGDTSTDGNYRLDVSKSGSAGTARFYDQTATTGATSVAVNYGASQTAKSVTFSTDARIGIALTTPTTSAETCTAGTFTADASYLYLCTSANTWKRAALSAF